METFWIGLVTFEAASIIFMLGYWAGLRHGKSLASKRYTDKWFKKEAEEVVREELRIASGIEVLIGRYLMEQVKKTHSYPYDNLEVKAYIRKGVNLN